MIKLEIDGKAVEAARGSMVIHAAQQAGIYIPHFCYHKKLSIAASCRMCLVEVEKAPKPLPACATPVAEGMKVKTRSDMAVKAQQGVMEFLLINHPLDCPICDQGGECQLQDIAVGYGASAARYTEEKRVISPKEVGELISTLEMSRCIQCTRCVRFGQEVAGIMELGMAFRTEHAQITSFVNRSITSELSGNMIDLCPVGALTSKPFRYTARSWELSRRKSVSPHDSVGANLAIHIKNNQVLRVTPVENEAVNECWISDKDRFSYEGLNAADRLTKPMLKQNGQWVEVEWAAALEYIANALRQIANGVGAEHIAALATPHSTLEELALLQKLLRGLGSNNVDFRLRQSDFSADAQAAGAPWLGMPIADLNSRDRFLVVGSFLRKDHPLLAQRIRAAVKKGAQANVLHASADDLLMPVANQAIVAPSAMVNTLAQVLKAVASAKGANVAVNVEVSPAALAIANSLLSGQKGAVLLGNLAQQHPQAAQLATLAQQIAELTGATFGYLGEAANSVGGYIAGAVPGKDGLNAAQMLASPRKAYLLLNVEPELDMHNPQAALQAMQAADLVVAMSAYKHRAVDYADVLLPIAPFTETSGTFVNTEGRAQSFKGAVKPLGEARPGWKVLRVLGNLLDVAGFDYNSSEAVRDDVLGNGDLAARLNNRISGITVDTTIASNGLERVSDVPIYSTDAVVRRAVAVHKTPDGAAPAARLHPQTLASLGLSAGEAVKVSQGNGQAVLTAVADEGLPLQAVRVAAGHEATSALGAMLGTITVERA